MNAKLQNGQVGSEFKAMLNENSGWKKFKPGGEAHLLMRFVERCTGHTTEMQFYLFGTPERHEEKNTDHVIWYTYKLEGTEQVNVPEIQSVLNSLTTQSTNKKRNDAGLRFDSELNDAHQ